MNLLNVAFFSFLMVISCQEELDVMKISNVPFPSSKVYPAFLNASFSKEIAEFTICYRFLIESYNDPMIYLLRLMTPNWGDTFYYNAVGWNTGYDLEGFQGARSFINRNVEGGGLVNKQLPRYASYVMARNIDISTWTHFCTSYSSSLQKMLRYQNGQKVMSFTFTDEKENPLPSDLFANTRIGKNLRGSITDLNIFSTFLDDKALIKWTTSCDERGGDIFTWDASKLELSQDIDVSIIKMDKKEVCPDVTKQIPIQRAKKVAKKTERKRFKPYLGIKSFVGMVLEMVSVREGLKYQEAEDVCFRTGGELMMIPQTKEEMDLMDKVLWDYIMQRAENNISVVDDINKNPSTIFEWEAPVGGLSPIIDEDAMKNEKGESYDPRELTYPNNGKVDLVDPWTGRNINPYGRGTIVWPVGMTSYKYPRMRYLCQNSLRKKMPGTYWYDRLTPLCFSRPAESLVQGNPICVYPKNPTFRNTSINNQNILGNRQQKLDY